MESDSGEGGGKRDGAGVKGREDQAGESGLLMLLANPHQTGQDQREGKDRSVPEVKRRI